MTLARYFANALLRYALIIFALFLMLTWLGELASLLPEETALDGSPLNLGMKLLLSLAWVLPETLDLMVFIFMLAAVIVLTILGRRAELHVLRGAGLSAFRILITLAGVTAVMMILLELGPRPLAHEIKRLADGHYDPQGLADQNTSQRQQVAWISAENGTFTGRLTGYDAEMQTAQAGRLQTASTDIRDSYIYLQNISLADNRLSASGLSLGSTPIELDLALDAPVEVLSALNVAEDIPLLYLFGWLSTPEVESYGARHLSYLQHRSMAQPFLAAALVMVAGTFCVGIGTRQPLGRLFFITLGLVVLTYSIFAVTEAFGIVGKLEPLLAAWGTFLLIGCLAGFILAVQALIWLTSAPSR